MELLEVLENEKKLYNQFVAAQESGSFLQSWEWGAWQESLGRKVYRFKVLDANGQMLLVTQLILMPLPLSKYYLYAPFGPVFAQGQESQGSVFKVQELLGQIKHKFSDAVFIRIEPKDKNLFTLHSSLVTKSPNIQPAKTLVIDLSKSPEQLLAQMHHKTRYNIKLAQKHGVEIKDEFSISVGHGIFFDEAIKLIGATAKRQKFMTFPESYYKKIADFFVLKNSGKMEQGQAGKAKGAVSLHVYKAIFQNQLLGAAFMVDFGQTRTFLFGGSSEVHKNVMAPYLLHYQAMLGAKTLGLNFYDFWGIETSGGETPGFVRFKLGFGPQTEPDGGIKEYGGAYDMVINQAAYNLYKLFRNINKLKRKILR